MGGVYRASDTRLGREIAIKVLPDREGTIYWLAWHPKEPRLAFARDNGDIALWDLARIDQQLTALGLGFAPESENARPIGENP